MLDWRVRLLLFSLTVAAAPGCVFNGHGGMTRIWCDYNTLQAPALFVEETRHWPYSEERVAYFNWMYNKPAPPPVYKHRGYKHRGQSTGHRAVVPNSTGTLEVPPEPASPSSREPEQIAPVPDPVSPPPAPPASPPDAPPAMNGPTAAKPAPIHQTVFRQASVRDDVSETGVPLRQPRRGFHRRPSKSWLFARP